MTEKVTPDLSVEFIERMDRTARFYQQAVMFLAEEQVAEIQAAIDAQVYEVSQPQPRFWQKVGTIAQNLFRRLTSYSLAKSSRKGGSIQK